MTPMKEEFFLSKNLIYFAKLDKRINRNKEKLK